jgi:hypothetical protein
MIDLKKLDIMHIFKLFIYKSYNKNWMLNLLANLKKKQKNINNRFDGNNK